MSDESINHLHQTATYWTPFFSALKPFHQFSNNFQLWPSLSFLSPSSHIRTISISQYPFLLTLNFSSKFIFLGKSRVAEKREMARGKIKIRRIENSTNRQVTYSKRRSGLFKKANELTVLCDATVSIIMFSSNNKLHEFLSPGVTMKQIYDRYQEVTGIDIWITHYQRMQADLQKLNEKNRKLQREIRQRMGDCLEDLSFDQLLCLEQDVENSVQFIRQRKYKVISNQIDTKRKKVRNEREIHESLLEDFDELQYGLVDNGDYNRVLGYDNGSHILALRLQPCPPPSLLRARGSGSGTGTGTGLGSCVTTYTLL